MSFSTTKINGKQCTAVPRNNNAGQNIDTGQSSVVTSTEQTSTSISTSPANSSIPAPAVATSAAQTTSQGSSTSTQTSASSASTAASDGASLSTILSTSGAVINPTAGLLSPSTSTSTAPSDAIESGNGGAGLTNGAANSTQTTVAVAGGVIGGLAAISIIGFLFWFWRKRTMEKRRSTLLTPLSSDNANERGEKGPYIISRNSLGPTTIPEKLRAVVGYNYQRIRGRVNSLVTRSPRPSVDLNRGNSQYGVLDTPASRSSSMAGSARTGTATTTKQRFVDWWGRLTEDSNLNWKISRGEPEGGQSGNTFAALPDTRASRPGSQSNLLPRRSQSLGNEHFLGGLGLDFEDPFADANAMSHDSAKVMPLIVSGANNPFSDANAITQPQPGAAGPATYVQNIRRSRGHSVASTSATLRPPSTAPASRMPSTYRVSAMTMDSVDPRLKRVRSDPFDLDRPEFVQSPGSGVGGVAGSSSGDEKNNGLPSMPRRSHTRAESFTSRYSSGGSLGEWSDPGPDVGPAGSRWNTPSPDGALGRILSNGSDKKSKPGGGQRNVGTAM
ncbi:hypothetical protein F5Y18DRAFT_417547 [Xylariaceae sp. FL1019]|nr:hypothetical protein F5Y18DRAFT_417547 [Xylariaceae sp. FL1019]